MRTLSLSCALLACAGAMAQQTNVLFIGNSYTYVNDLPNTFRAVALSMGDTVNVASSAPGGYTFQQHSTNAGTLAAIASQPWDFVVLQEQSQIPSFPQAQVEQECYPYAGILVDSILANDACTQPVFYMTWGRQFGDADNCAVWPPVCTYEGMQSQLRYSYLNMAVANNAFCAPAGVAWQHVRESYPMLNLYNPDQSHPSVAGTYVVANVMYATMFRTSTVGATYTAGLAPDTALFIQQIASSTVLDSLGAWNIGVNDPDAGFTVTLIPGSCAFQFNAAAQGSHAWSFGDGDTSTITSPTHVYVSSSTGLVATHTITDACGRTATATLLMPDCTVGVNEHVTSERPTATVQDHWIRFAHVPQGSTIALFDGAGRSLATLSGVLEQALPCDLHFCVWRMTLPNGTIVNGRNLVP